MQTVSTLYNTIFAGPHTHEVKLNIAGRDYGMDVLASLNTSIAPFGSGTPQMGLAPAAEITTSLYLESSSVPRMAELRPYVRIVSTEDPTLVSEWLSQGVFFVDTREQDASGILTLHGYDAMLKADRKQPYSTLNWPALDTDVVREICGILGFTVDARTTALMTGAFRINLPTQYTMREALKYIAALYGGSFIMTPSGALRLLPLWQRGSTADHDLTASVQSLTLSPVFPACTGVRFLTENETEYFAGSESGYVYEIASPFATQAAANALRTRLSGFVYRPYVAEGAILNPAAEPGDTVLIPATRQEPTSSVARLHGAAALTTAADSSATVLSSLFSLDRTFDSLFPAEVSAPQDEELDHEYPYESTADRVYARKLQNMQSELNVQAAQISAKVSRTGGDASSFGWYLDADRFSLYSDTAEVMHVDDEGLTVNGTVNATAGNIGGCSIENGVLKIANANVENLNASKITAGTLSIDRIGAGTITESKIQDYTLDSDTLASSAVINRTIGGGAVSYGKTSFQSTLDQVGTNKANIDVLYGYFTGYAHFSQMQVDTSFIYAGKTIGLVTNTVSGRTLQYLGWQ